MLVAGGAFGSGAADTAVTEIFSPSTGTWKTVAPLAHARHNATATVLQDGRVLVLGGNDDTTVFSSAELFDPATDTWSAAANMPTPRLWHTATLLQDGRVLVAGGKSSSGGLATADIYDPATNTWSSASPMSTIRFLHTATLLKDGRVLVTGGANDELGGQASATTEIYDPASNTWTPGPPMANARYEHTATLLTDGSVLVAGGYGGNGTAERYDPLSNTWSSAGAIPGGPRREQVAVRLDDGRVLIAGGADEGFTRLSSAATYDPNTNSWLAEPAMASARYGATGTLLPDGRVLVAGGLNGSVYVNTAELYVPAGWTPPPPTDTTPPTITVPANITVDAQTSRRCAGQLHGDRV